MGRDKHEATTRQGLGRPRVPAGQARDNGFLFTSFYPTKEQKEKIHDLLWTTEDLIQAHEELAKHNIVLTFKEEQDKNCYKLLLREDVPFGEPCKAVAFWHIRVSTLIQMYLYWMSTMYQGWLDSSDGTQVQQQFDW